MIEHEYNLLTEKLLEAGFTTENHPDHVQICASKRPGTSPLNNLEGGFVYKKRWIFEKAFKTPCGIQCKGISCHSGMGYMSIDWTYENDMATIRCPYHKDDCNLKHELLQGLEGVLEGICNVHMVDEEYQYEGSIEHLQKLYDDEIQRRKVSFILQKHGRVCPEHMRYDKDSEEWVMHYHPAICARSRCRGRCPVLGRQLDKKRGNVYYDLKTTFPRYDLDGTLFEGQTDTSIIKGKRMFDNPISMDICRIFVKLCKDEIIQKEEMKHHRQLFFAEYHRREFSIEVLNIRAEQKESRDLLQDLQDIKDGIKISHDSDNKKETAEVKKEDRKKSRESQIAALEKRLIEVGYWNLEEYSPERRHADKWLPSERIDELEVIRQKKIKEEQEKPVQLSLFDFQLN